MNDEQPRPWITSMVVLAAIWGASFALIKVGVEAFAPLHVALGRVVFGLLAILAALALVRDRLPSDRRVWSHLFLLALLWNSVPNTLFAYGETVVSSVLAGIWNATTPLLTLLFSLLLLTDERATGARVGGLAVGFLGVLVLLGSPGDLDQNAVLGSLACFAAAGCYALGFVHTRRNLSDLNLSGLEVTAGQLLCATGQLALASLLFTTPPEAFPLVPTASIVALGVGGTGLAYVINLAILRRAGATNASMVTYVIPVFSTAFGVLILGEAISWTLPIGAVLVLAGVAMASRIGFGVRDRAVV